MEFLELKEKKLHELQEIAKELGIKSFSNMKKEELVYEIMRQIAKKEGADFREGILEIHQEGYGFLRSPKNNYLQGQEDVYVSLSQIKRFGLRTGDRIAGLIKIPTEMDGKYPALVKIESINGRTPEEIKKRPFFDDLTPFFPEEKFKLEREDEENYSMRVVDLFTPIGKGQRGLIVSPPRAGKTVLLQ
jgi:transcription termination factor Rho